MDKAEEAKIARGGWPALGLAFVYAFLFACGVHLGQIAAIADPWPENMGALFSSLLSGRRAFSRIGQVYVGLLLIHHLSTYAAFQSPAQLMATVRGRLMRLDRRHVAVIIGIFVFILPLLMAGGTIAPSVLLGFGVLVGGGALLLNMGTTGRAILGVVFLAAGFVDFDTSARRSYDLNEDCRPGAQIMLKSGETLACTSIQELGLYHGVLIRNETKTTFVPIDELDQPSVVDAVGRMGNLLF